MYCISSLTRIIAWSSPKPVPSTMPSRSTVSGSASCNLPRYRFTMRYRICLGRMNPSRNAAASPPINEPAPFGLSLCRYTVPAASASTKISTPIEYSASALLRRTPACARSFSVPFIQSSPPGTVPMRYSRRSRPVPELLRRVVTRELTTSACDCSPSNRSPSGSSWVRNTSTLVHTSRLSVAPVNRKKRMLVTMPSYLDVGDLADHQNAHDLRTDRVREKLAAHRIGPQQPHILRLQNPEPDADHQRQAAQQARRKPLLRRMRLELCRHVQSLADQCREVLQNGHHVGAGLPLQ